MISRPDRRKYRSAAGAGLLALAALVSAGPGAADGSLAANLLRDGRAALTRGDGVAAEIALRKALAAGAPRELVAARMGEALLDQGNLRGARDWLGPGHFAPQEAAHGWRMLGRLELAAHDPAAAGRAFDAALRLIPRDSQLWVDIARMRYLGGEQVQAIAAADAAVRFDPRNPRALEFRGLLVRDSFGLPAALPWFERGLQQAPDDPGLLGEYAATLAELGRAREAVTITRRMIALDPHSARAFMVQAVIAARAGNAALARTLLAKAGDAALATPAGLLLSGIIELESGNAHLAVELLDRLVRRQPDNARAQLLLARALAISGNADELLNRFGPVATRGDASPYLLTLLGRTLEERGRRDLAAPLLERAALAAGMPVWVLPPAGDPAIADLRRLLAAGSLAPAGQAAARLRAAAPGATVGMLAEGDVAFVRGDLAGAMAAYRQAAGVRMTDRLLLRLVASALRAGQPGAARQLVAGFRSGWPRDPLGLRLAAGFAAADGQWARAAALLGALHGSGLDNDARVQADLALARFRSGDQPGAAEAARRAYRLQRLALTATQALGMADEPGARGQGGDHHAAPEPASDLGAKAVQLEAASRS